MLDGYTNPDFCLIGIEPLLGLNAALVYIGGDSKAVIAQCSKGKILEDKYDLFDFSLDPFDYLGHYSTWLVEGEARFHGRMGLCPDEVHMGEGITVQPAIGALNAAADPDVNPKPKRN